MKIFESQLQKPEKLKVPERIQKMLAGITEDRQDYSDFEDLYSPEEIASDVEQVENIKRGFELKLKRLDPESARHVENLKEKSELFEAFCLSRPEWFGEKSTMIITKEKDDLENGVDAVLEHIRDEEKRHIGLALDITFNTTGKLVSDKLQGIEQEVRRGVLGTVKYIETEEGVGLGHIPRLVVGVAQDRVDSLLKLWFSSVTDQGEMKDMTEKMLKNHTIQIVFLRQMKAQLWAFKHLAASLGHDDAILKFQEAETFIMDLLEEKDNIYQSHKARIDEDPALIIIERYARSLYNQVERESAVLAE
ncbi:MAG: hypothetical protein KBC22_00255 [Candidatus Pacebacteria bacterium]|nr:hypothetical protein [Candidatus Paceibacterota bacterium]